MCSIAVYYGTSRELIGITLCRHLYLTLSSSRYRGGYCAIALFSIECFSETAIVLLALLVALAILKEHTALGSLCPIVAVVSIEMTLIETELGQQHRVTGELIEIIEQCHGTLIDHHEEVEVVTIVLHLHQTISSRVEVIYTLLEGIPHHTIATGRPVERSGRSHTTVNPIV